MERKEDIVNKSIDAMMKMEVPAGPPAEVIDATIAKLKENDGLQQKSGVIKLSDRVTFKHLFKYAAAAVIMVSAGYIAGRLSSPKAPDIEEIQAALAPAIRQELLQDIIQYTQVSLAGSFAQLKEDIQKQYRQDLSDFAIQTLAATNAVTNQRLENLVNAISTVQNEDRRSVATALEQIELNRRLDKNQLATGLETLALQTEDELKRTRQDMAQLLSYAQPDSIGVDKSNQPK
jgi:hypothetical protein